MTKIEIDRRIFHRGFTFPSVYSRCPWFGILLLEAY